MSGANDTRDRAEARAPLRLPLAGGGTDLPSYYQRYGGYILAVAIDCQVRVRLRRSKRTPPDPFLAAAAPPGLDIEARSPLPPGSGLGSSGACLVAVRAACRALEGLSPSPAILAEEAWRTEAITLGRPVGKQDHYVSAFGGLLRLDIEPDGSVRTRRLPLSDGWEEEFLAHVRLFDTGIRRSSAPLLEEQRLRVLEQDARVLDSLHRSRQLGFEIEESLRRRDWKGFGLLLARHWELKRARSKSVSSSHIDRCYDLAREVGCWGGKIPGAGGGGYLMLCSPPEKYGAIRRALAQEGLREQPFALDGAGAVVENTPISDSLAHAEP
ncbi:MAG: hypothetical protein HY549_00365 [Elusimicrobia bacterium]|nr:hypothetical protein [Elusimicrobiota bacterium]